MTRAHTRDYMQSWEERKWAGGVTSSPEDQKMCMWLRRNLNGWVTLATY